MMYSTSRSTMLFLCVRFLDAVMSITAPLCMVLSSFLLKEEKAMGFNILILFTTH